MANAISKTQLDRLGDRLRKGNMSEADLRLLDQYRRSFSDAYERVVGTIRKELSLELTGRPAKSTPSIVEKLRRESIRLTQMQDIAGCRVIVSDIENQEEVIQSLTRVLERTTIVDRRLKPSHGYRAVHVIVDCLDKMIEIQIRTALQHLWAEVSEKFSDVIGPAIKYGGGDVAAQKRLSELSALVAEGEIIEKRALDLKARYRARSLTDEQKQMFVEGQEKIEWMRRELSTNLHQAIGFVEKLKG